VPIFPDTRDGRAARLAYSEARKLNNLPNSLYDYHARNAASSRQPSATRANDATTALPDRPTATKRVVLPPFRDAPKRRGS
jgi:hypothetical protein